MNTNPSTFTRRAALGLAGGALALSVSAFLAPVVGASPAAPPTVAGKQVAAKPSLRLVTITQVYRAGSYIKFFGQVQNSRSAVVRVERQDPATKKWVAVNSHRVSNVDGFFTVSVKIASTGYYRGVIPAVTGQGAVYSAPEKLEVSKRATASPKLAVTASGLKAVYRLTDDKGAPVVNAIVWVNVWEKDRGAWTDIPVRQLRTNRNGEAVFKLDPFQQILDPTVRTYQTYFFGTSKLNPTVSDHVRLG